MVFKILISAGFKFVNSLFQAPGVLQPLPSTAGYYKVQNALSYIGTEVHSTVSKLFNPHLHADTKHSFIELYHQKLKYLNDKILGEHEYIVEDKLSIADIYLYIVLSWSPHVGIDNSPYPNLIAFSERIAGLEQVKAAHARIATSPATSI